MSYKYEEVVDLIKQSKKSYLKMPKHAVRILILGGTGFAFLVSGAVVGYFPNVSKTISLSLTVIGIIMMWLFLILSNRFTHSNQSKGKEEITAFLENFKRELHSIDIKTKEDIITLQTEIQTSIGQSDKQWEKILSTIKWAFCVFVISPIGFALSVTFKSIFENVSPNSTLWYELIIKLTITGALATTIIVALMRFIDLVRKCFGPYKQKWEVYHHLEDVKYIHTN